MKNIRYTLLILGVLVISIVCLSATKPIPRYSDKTCWHSSTDFDGTHDYDIFFIIPTCVNRWYDEDKNPKHNANIWDKKQREKMEYSFKLGKQIYADSANYFSPYYRQATLDTFNYESDIINSRFKLGMDDVRNAFTYYLNHYNNGRPFVLCGFSQGSKCVIELLKEMPATVKNSLIAAYVMGYFVTEEDLKSKNIIPATDETSTGVTIVYSSVTDIQQITPQVNGKNKAIINPVSWTTDEKWHNLNDSVRVKISCPENTLLVEGVDPKAWFNGSLQTFIPLGNLHLADFNLYEKQIRENVHTRARSYFKQHRNDQGVKK